MDDDGGQRDGTRGGPAHLRGEGDRLDPAHGMLRKDLVDRALAGRLGLAGEQGHGNPGDAVAVTVGPPYGRPLIRIKGQDPLGYSLHPRPRAERGWYRIYGNRVHRAR